MSAKTHLKISTRPTIIPAPADDPKWEYLDASNPETRYMNDLGKSGWELICVAARYEANVFYFKRKVRPS